MTTIARTTPASSGSAARRRISQHDGPVLGGQVYDWLREAMTWFERAEAIRPAANDDSLLRWNACARTVMRDHRLVPETDERSEPLLLE